MGRLRPAGLSPTTADRPGGGGPRGTRAARGRPAPLRPGRNAEKQLAAPPGGRARVMSEKSRPSGSSDLTTTSQTPPVSRVARGWWMSRSSSASSDATWPIRVRRPARSCRPRPPSKCPGRDRARGRGQACRQCGQVDPAPWCPVPARMRGGAGRHLAMGDDGAIEFLPRTQGTTGTPRFATGFGTPFLLLASIALPCSAPPHSQKDRHGCSRRRSAEPPRPSQISSAGLELWHAWFRSHGHEL